MNAHRKSDQKTSSRTSKDDQAHLLDESMSLGLATDSHILAGGVRAFSLLFVAVGVAFAGDDGAVA